MSNNHAPPGPPVLPYFVAKLEGRAVTIKRDANYKTTMNYVRKSIPKLRLADTQNLSIFTTLTDYGGMLVQISEETWPDIVDCVKIAEISLDDTTEADHVHSGTPTGEAESMDCILSGGGVPTITTTDPSTPSANISTGLLAVASFPVRRPTASTTDRFSITIRTTFGKFLGIDHIHPFSTVGSLMANIEKTYGPLQALQNLSLPDRSLDAEEVLDESGITAGATLNLVLATRKSLIFCRAPHRGTRQQFTLSEVKVKLVVDRVWELVALAPSENLECGVFRQAASWTVDVAVDGTLWNHESKTEVDCLFWEGIREPFDFLRDLPRAKLRHSDEWLKSVATVAPDNCAVVSIQQAESYISTVLSVVGFEFSSKFLSRFMPQLESKPWTHLALRFLSQAESEALSYLEFDPSPQLIVHVVMLYKGLSDLDDLAWGTSLLTLTEGSDAGKLAGAEAIEPASRNVFSTYEVTWMEVF
ncbi:hypothetical protein FRC08_006633 [Ceratobasidium sp. 394]|nr:hypothetical protein FRC08_006633 [Ceratobasidium sp. 394]